MPTVIVCSPDRVDVALLVHGLRRDLQPAVAPDHVLEDAARALVVVERARDRLDRARRDLVALADQVGQLADDGLGHLHLGRSSPSSVSTLPRRKTSQSRWPSSVFMIASPGPASSAATSLVSSSCVAH